MNYTLQLSVSGTPSAWDLSPSGEGFVIASPGCLTFFRLQGLGSPRHVIHYEQPQQVRQVKHQRQGGLLISALRAGVVSLWEPAKSLRPLLGHVRSQGGNITDMSWSPRDMHILATSSDAGHASLWDVRVPTWPVQQVIAGGLCSKIDWCPLNSNLVSVLAQAGQKLIVFDTRMVGPNNGANARESVATIEADGGISHASWFAGGQQPLAAASTSASSASWTYSLVLGTGMGRLAYWDISSGTSSTIEGGAIPSSNSSFTGGGGGGGSGLRSNQFASISAQSGGVLIDSTSQLLATPIGRGAVVCRSTTVPTALQVLRLQGCPRDSLLNAFSPPDARQAKGALEYGPSIELAHGFASPVLEMKWGTPGRLVPPVHSGLELLVLTESACLTAIRVPMDLVRKFCFAGITKISGGSGSGDFSLLDQQQSGEVPSKPSTVESKVLVLGPTSFGASRHPLSNLKSRHSHKSEKNRSEGIGGAFSLMTPLFQGGGPGRGETSGGAAAGPSSSTSSDQADKGGERFWASIRGDVLALEDAVGRNLLPGLTISRIDQYARQVTLEIELSRDERQGAKDRRRRESLSVDRELGGTSPESRFINVIVRYPFRGVPSFAFRGLEGAEEAAAGTEIVAELDAIAAKYFAVEYSQAGSFQPTRRLSTDRSEDGFLLAVAHSVRNRCASPLTPRGFRQPGVDEGDEVFRGTKTADGPDEAGEDAKEVNARRETDRVFIDPIAYRVPSPACSGGCWSAKGVLVCFGGAVLVCAGGDTDGALVEPSGENEGFAREYPKSLGDMLIMERAREEAYAQQMAYLKQMQISHQQFSAAEAELDDGSASGSGSGSIIGSDSDSSDDDNSNEQKGESTAGRLEEPISSVARTSSLSRAPDLSRTSSLRGGNQGMSSLLPLLSTGSFDPTTTLAAASGSDNGLVSAATVKTGPPRADGSLGQPVPLNRTVSGLSNKTSYSGLDEHLLPLLDPTHAGQTLESLGEDLDLIAKAAARTAGFRRTLPLALNNNDRNLWLAAAAVASTSAIMSQAPTLLTFYQALSTLPQQLAEQYSLGPLPRHGALATTQKGKQRRDLLDVKARAAACRSNAETVSRLGGAGCLQLPYSMHQIWSLLAVSLDMHAAAQENPDGLASEGGALLRWADSVLGCGLLRRVLLLLTQHHDVQFLATCVCVLGGPAQTIALMYPPNQDATTAPLPAESGEILLEQISILRGLLDRSLVTYADILCRWGFMVKAVEVYKHETAFSPAGDNKGDRNMVGLGVSCSRCRGAATVLASKNSNYPNAFWCVDCRDFAIYCAICMASVRCTAFFCASCGHGGHPDHVKTWFEQSVECPTGCGCRCQELGVSLKTSPSFAEPGEGTDPPGGSHNSQGDYSLDSFDRFSPNNSTHDDHQFGGFEDSARYGWGHLWRD